MKKPLPGFTLIEMLAVIALIAIIALGTTRINFKNITDVQKSEVLAQRVIGKMQTIKNYAVTGYGIGPSLFSPLAWRFSVKTGSGFIESYYLDASRNWQPYIPNRYTFTPGENISQITCINYFSQLSQDITESSIDFYATGISLPSCSQGLNVLQIKTRFGGLSKTIQINTLNSLIEPL